jgi:nitrogen regulatory protein PII
MKLVKAYIRPMLLEDVYTALRKEGHCCMTVFEGEGTGRFSDPNDQHGSLNFPAMHTHVAKIEIAVESEDVATVIDIIKKHGKTGHKGDGIVFVCPIERVTRIRDGKEGATVLN